MNARVTYIVGDYFKEFAKCANVLTCSRFLESLKNDRLNRDQTYVLGQGIPPELLTKILDNVAEKRMKHLIHPGDVTPAEKELTHKHTRENIMITSPVKVSDDLYRSNLRIDYPAELHDHLTGKHIPGMALNEASRQMFIAVSEKYFNRGENGQRGNYYFVINDFNAKYLRFVFPTTVLINYKIKAFKQRENGSLGFHVEIVFFQAFGKCVYKSDISFSMYDHNYLSAVESKMVEKSLCSEPEKTTSTHEYLEVSFQ